MTSVIRFENVTKFYRVRGTRKIILDGLNLELPPRNIGILGGNGAGKSTMLRLIAGSELPNSGRIRRMGRVSWPLGFAASFNGSLTGAENARFVARIYGQDPRKILDFVEDFSELGNFFYMPVSTYSSGMRARLAFGVSMSMEFDTYLVDEITEVGDQRFKQRCRQHFKTKLGGANIIMVSHGLTSLRSYCDMGIVLKNGQVYVFDDIEKAISEHERNMKAA